MRVRVHSRDRMHTAGNMDGSSCNHLGVSRVVEEIPWSGQAKFANASRRVWHVDGTVAGFAKSSDNLNLAIITNSGHLVPTDQPEAAFDMVWRFIHHESFD